MAFTDQKPFVATAKDAAGNWGCKPNGERFRCYLCGRKFVAGDVVRWVYAASVGTINFLTCQACDGPDVLERWKQHHDDAKLRFWWIYDN